MLRPVGSPIRPVPSPMRKMTGVAQVLKVLHLAQQHGVAQVQIGRGGIEADFDAQRAAGGEALVEILLADDLDEALLEIRDLFFQGMPGHLTIVTEPPPQLLISGSFEGSWPGGELVLQAASPLAGSVMSRSPAEGRVPKWRYASS